MTETASPPATTAGAAPAVPVRGAARFPKSRRVLDRRDFQRIQNRGVRVGGQRFLVLALRQPGVPAPARLGITASRKSGESVQRNRFRRVVREAFRLAPQLFPDGWDIVIIARQGCETITLSQVSTELRQAADKLRSGRVPTQPSRPGPRRADPSRGKPSPGGRPSPGPGAKKP